MQFISFDSTEQMQDYIAKAAEEAHAGLHVDQDAITFGDCWVQFHDIDNRHLVFGRVHLPEETAAGESASNEEEMAYVLQLLETDAARLAEGMMFGRAYDRFNVEGELGHTHKAHVWPISAALFEAARECGWDVANLAVEARPELEAAFSSMKAHVLGVRSE